MSRFSLTAGFLLVALPAFGQLEAGATVTIKPARAVDPRNTGVQLRPNGDLVASAVSVTTLFSQAYDVPVNSSQRLSALPDWTVGEKYDIEVKAAGNSAPPTSSDREARSRIWQMIRQVLASRFGLVMSVTDKEMPVYALTVASGGPRLQKSAVAGEDCAFRTGPEACHSFAGGFGHPLNAVAIDMDDLVHYISNWTDLPAVNRTELNGLFGVQTEGWIPMRLPPHPANVTPPANPFAGLPTLFTVLGKLGLELKRQEDVLPVYTVERIERPLFN
jgi:uncharacterized protein (TIGR03435 family)